MKGSNDHLNFDDSSAICVFNFSNLCFQIFLLCLMQKLSKLQEDRGNLSIFYGPYALAFITQPFLWFIGVPEVLVFAKRTDQRIIQQFTLMECTVINSFTQSWIGKTTLWLLWQWLADVLLCFLYFTCFGWDWPSSENWFSTKSTVDWWTNTPMSQFFLYMYFYVKWFKISLS